MQPRNGISVLLPVALLLSAAIACSSGKSAAHEYTLQGQVLSLVPGGKEATIKHEDINGLMPAMTMPYHVRDAKELTDISAGDLIAATLVVVTNDAYLKDVRKVGHAPLEKAAAPSASSGFELLKSGEPVPSAQFVDQDGRTREFQSFRGSTVLVTFIYTKCPMPTFCPLMDRHFAAIQKQLKTDPSLNVRLVSISFDPVTDTPPVLKKHAGEIGADPKIWTFLTGDRDVIDQFASRFGVSITREMNDQRDITHNLRTAIVDRQGKLVKVYTGNEWMPEQALADIKGLAGAD